MTDKIVRPNPMMIEGVEHARISCRKYNEQKVRQTGAHHAYLLNCSGNVLIKIEKSYSSSNECYRDC